MSVYAADGAIYLNGVTEDVISVSIIDMAGKIVYNSKPEFDRLFIPVNRGVYVVLVKGTKGNVSTKVICQIKRWFLVIIQKGSPYGFPFHILYLPPRPDWFQIFNSQRVQFVAVFVSGKQVVVHFSVSLCSSG